jgi:hypothetical protein
LDQHFDIIIHTFYTKDSIETLQKKRQHTIFVRNSILERKGIIGKKKWKGNNKGKNQSFNIEIIKEVNKS